MSILEKLLELKQSNMYPMHMPGHKRVAINSAFPYELDITEIHDFDDLHQAEGILKSAQEAAAKLYGAKESFYLVNGSTCGILAAVSAAVPMGGRVLVARNCHKAVYHAIQLRNAEAIYLYPQADPYGIFGPCDLPEDLPLVDACIITSPTYEGRVSDIKAIAEKLHEKGIPLIVDEAHGAHFVFDSAFPQPAGALGADLVINSIHKTLPAPTQTALLHRYSDRVSGEKLKLYLDIYETSSPSYVLMAVMEEGLAYAKGADWKGYEERLADFYEKTKDLAFLRVIRTDDPGKIVVAGKAVGSRLRGEFQIEPEMESLYYTILMTSVMDSKEGFDRLIRALKALDREENRAKAELKAEVSLGYFGRPVKTIGQAVEEDKEEIPLSQACGRISGAYVYLYPPGIPIFVPGEEIKDLAIDYIFKCMERGLCVQGLNSGKIQVLKD